MKSYTVAVASLVAFLTMLLLFGGAGNSEEEKPRNIYEQLAKTRYSKLNQEFDGRLDPLFSNFSNLQEIHAFIRSDDKKTQEAFRKCLLAAIEDSLHGDVVEGMFLEFLLSVTPKGLLVDVVVPEIEDGGRLKGLLDQRNHVRRHIEDYVSPGYVPAGRSRYVVRKPDFMPYLPYLDRDNRDKHPVLMRHVFRTDPTAALDVLSDATNSLRDQVNVREIAFNAHILTDALWLQMHKFEVEPERLIAAKSALQKLSSHKQFWVRLYVAEILRQHPEFKSPEVIEQLKQDEHELVRESAELAANAQDKVKQQRARTVE